MLILFSFNPVSLEELYQELDLIDPEEANHCAELDLKGLPEKEVRACFNYYLSKKDPIDERWNVKN